MSLALVVIAAALAGFSGKSVFEAIWALLRREPIPNENIDKLSYILFAIALVLMSFS